MSESFAYEVGLVQNEALGAYLMFRTVKAYEETEKTNSGCPLHLLFLVLPILYQKDISTILVSTRPSSGIRKFSNKFSSLAEKRADVLLRVHEFAELYKKLSWDSFCLGIKANLLAIIPEDALVISKNHNIPKKYEYPAIRPMLRGADRLGIWFAKNSLYEIASNLKVRF